MEAAEQIYAPGRSRVLVVTAVDVHGKSGMDTHAWRLAAALSRDYDVILATPATGAASDPSFAVVYYNRRNLALLSGDSDVVVVEAEVVSEYDFFSNTGKLFRTDWDTIISGRLDETALRQLEMVPAGPDTGLPDVRIWLPPDEKRGPVHYLRRLRFHMRAGGPRRVLSRGWKLVRSRLRPGNSDK